jgi:hypothetical protein
MTNLCIVRVAGGVVTSLTGEALMLLDSVGGGSGGETEGHEVVVHLIHAFPALSCIFNRFISYLGFPYKV